MKKKKWMFVGILSVLLCTTGIALGQHHLNGQGMGMNSAPLTPAQKAKKEEIGRLDQAALAAMNGAQYDEAEANARQSISLGRDSGLAQEMLAASLNAQGRTLEALQAYKMIADEGDVEPRNEFPYALLLLKSGHWAQAVDAYNKALPYLGSVDLIRANSHFSHNVPQPRELETALHMVRGVSYIGGAWGSHSQHEEAMNEFDQALRLAPDSPLTNYYYGYGWQHLDLKSRMRAANAQPAKAAFQKAAALGGADVKKAAAEELKSFR